MTYDYLFISYTAELNLTAILTIADEVIEHAQCHMTCLLVSAGLILPTFLKSLTNICKLICNL